jgi:hypothetical protein
VNTVIFSKLERKTVSGYLEYFKHLCLGSGLLTTFFLDFFIVKSQGQYSVFLSLFKHVSGNRSHSGRFLEISLGQ